MLNRLFIVLGLIVILVLAAAFIVPHVVPWANYRGRMEALAGEALGTPVAINGDISFALLPSPHLVLDDVVVGPPGRQLMAVTSADADFSLLDFLRDRYSMTRLVLQRPQLDLTISPDGRVSSGIRLAGGEADNVLSVAQAAVSDGTLSVTDQGAGRRYQIGDIDGNLSIGALNGPFSFNGGGRIGDRHFSFRLNASALDAAGSTQVSAIAQPDGNGFSVDLEGALATAGVPHLTGTLAYRQAPPAADNPNGVIGELTFTTRLDMTPEKAVLASFVLVPDENRGATRLSGSGSVDLGAKPSFTASVSSNVLAMPPRDVTAEQGPQPYELVRMLGELPLVPVPPIAGTLTGTVDEVDLRGLTLTDVSLDAATDGMQWSVDSFTGQLPGHTTVKLAGAIGSANGAPSFAGSLAITSDRLDALAALWRKPPPGNPLFNASGSFQSKVSLSDTAIAFTDGQLTLDRKAHQFTSLISFGNQRSIDLSGQFGDLGAADTAALLALAPDLAQDPSAAVTFPQGAVSFTANSADMLGLTARKLDIEGKWGPDGVQLSRLAADDFGGARLDLALGLGGSLAAPRLSGDGTIGIASADAPALALLFNRLGTPPAIRAWLARSLPLAVKAHLDTPDDRGGQGLTLTGKAGAADMTAVATLDGGLLRALAAPVDLTLNLEADDPTRLTAQLGLGDVSLTPEPAPMLVTASATGDPGGALSTRIDVSGGGDSIDFAGTVTPGNLTAVTAGGQIEAKLSRPAILAADLGLGGLYPPALQGTAKIALSADGGLALDAISAKAAGEPFRGQLHLVRQPQGAVIAGALDADSLDVAGLLAGVGGPLATMKSANSAWPDGPLSLGDAPRSTTGSVTVTSPRLTRAGTPLATDARFDFDWDATNTAVHGLSARFGNGSVRLDANLCCAGPLAQKTLGGEATLTGVGLDSVLPAAPAGVLSGRLDGSVRFSGSGDSVAALLAGLSGDGSYAVDDFAVRNFDPSTFAGIAAMKDIVDTSPADLTAQVAAGIAKGPFAVPKLEGGFTIAGGVLDLANVAAETADARLFGDVTLKLADLTLGGSVALSPARVLDAAGLVGPTTANVSASLSGTLPAPVRTLDVADMVETIKVRALENEVARLEKLKAADDARAKADASANKEEVEDEARRQLQAQRAAEQAAAAAETAAAQEAETDAAAKRSAAQAAAQNGADAAAAATQSGPAAVPQPLRSSPGPASVPAVSGTSAGPAPDAGQPSAPPIPATDPDPARQAARSMAVPPPLPAPPPSRPAHKSPPVPLTLAPPSYTLQTPPLIDLQPIPGN